MHIPDNQKSANAILALLLIPSNAKSLPACVCVVKPWYKMKMFVNPPPPPPPFSHFRPLPLLLSFSLSLSSWHYCPVPHKPNIIVVNPDSRQKKVFANPTISRVLSWSWLSGFGLVSENCNLIIWIQKLGQKVWFSWILYSYERLIVLFNKMVHYKIILASLFYSIIYYIFNKIESFLIFFSLKMTFDHILVGITNNS